MGLLDVFHQLCKSHTRSSGFLLEDVGPSSDKLYHVRHKYCDPVNPFRDDVTLEMGAFRKGMLRRLPK